MNSPLFSAVSAGSPLPVDDQGEAFNVSRYLIRHPESSFYVQVSGNSMIDAGINDGDILVVDKTLEPRQGSVVVARIMDGFTVKLYDSRAGRLRLVPANHLYSPLEPSDDCSLCGVATFVIHRL